MADGSIAVLHLAGPLFEVRSEEPPDLIVVSGDLAEQARPGDYARALERLSGVCERFGLDRDRVAVVPGERDVNRNKCRAYFLERADEEEGPQPPYWPKWRPYADFFQEFYRGVEGARFLPDQWWSFFEVPALRTVVAAFNSTVGHTHLEQSPELGGQQVRWFRRELGRYQAEGWLRIGLSHHAPARLSGLPGRLLHVLLCAEPGRSRLGDLPVLGPGPEVIRVGEPERPDGPSIAASGPRAVAIGRDNYGPVFTGDLAGARAEPIDDLLARTGEICAARMPDARVEAVRPPRRRGYLRVTRQEELWTSSFPIGVCEGELTREAVEEFVRTVDAQHRAGDSSLTSFFVHEGRPAPAGLREWAAAKGVRIQSLAEFQGLYDLRPYADRQAAALAGDRIYPSQLYVSQRYSVVGSGTDGHDLLARLRRWAADYDGRFVVVLGDFGHGKTFLLRELAKVVHASQEPPIVPVLVELRQLDKAQGIDGMLAAHLAKSGEEVIDLRTLRALIHDGRVLLLFDGFDELALRVTYQRAAEYLESLIQAAGGRAKIVLTSRTQHFLSDQQVETALSSRLAALPGRRLVKVLDFDQDQILRFLTNRLGSAEAAQARFELLEGVRDLLGLSRNPRMLDFIARLDESRLRDIQAGRGLITAADLYRELLEQWLVYEYERSVTPGSPPGLSVEERWAAITHLAMRMWESGEMTLGVAELGSACEALSDLADRQITEDEATHMVGSGTLMVRTEDGRFTFVHQSVMEWLVANHMAERIAAGERALPELWRKSLSGLLSQFLKELAGVNALAFLPAEGADLRGSYLTDGAVLAGRDLQGVDLREAMLSGADLRTANLCGADLRDAVLTSVPGQARTTLADADLGAADLSGARLLGVDLRGAKVEHAKWQHAALIGAVLDRNFRLNGRTGFGAALPGVMSPCLELPAPSKRSRSLAWHPDGRIIASVENDGVRLWDFVAGRSVTALALKDERIMAVAWHPDGRLLTIASLDGVIRLWDPTARRIKETFHFSAKPLVAQVAWHPRDKVLAILAGGALYLRVEGAARYRVLCDEATEVAAFDWSPDGDAVVTVSGMGRTVRLWDPSGRRLPRIVGDGAKDPVAVAWHPDGAEIAIVSKDGRIDMWRADGSRPPRTRFRVGHRCDAIAWHPTDGSLATATVSGVTIHRASYRADLSDQPQAVQTVSWHARGTRLATGGRGAHLWDFATGRLVSREQRMRYVDALTWCGNSLFLAGADGSMAQWIPAQKHLTLDHANGRERCRDIACSPDGSLLATVDDLGLHLRPVGHNAGGSPVTTLLPDTADTKIAWSPDGRLIASAGLFSLRILHAQSGQETHSVSSRVGSVSGLAWHPGGTLLTTIGTLGMAHWSGVGDDALTPVFEESTPDALSVAWHPDGRHLALGCADGGTRVWDTVRKEVVATLLPLPDGSAAFSADGLTYKYQGDPDGRFWWSSGLCTFAPGELDPYEPGLRRVLYDTPLSELNRR